MKSQCKQNVNYDQRATKQSKSLLSKKGYYNVTMILTMVLLFCLVSTGNALRDQKCPSICSCTVESIVFCNNQGLKTTPLDFTSIVEKLYLFNNNISTILPKSLEPMKNLKILDISGNRITNFALWDGIFSDLKLLENLMLQDNQITKITTNMFKGLSNLARIYLHNNQISVIENGAFNNLPNLVELKLRNNRLMTFPKIDLSPNLLLLDLGYNKIRTIRDMALSTVNVETLMLQSNRLTQLRTSVFDETNRIRQLDISNNRLTAIPQIVKSLKSLRTLNISLNKIQHIPKQTFVNLTKLKTLDLHGIGLKYLPDGIIPPRVILNVFDVTDNDWNCGCETKWFPGYIRIFKQAFVNPDEMKCSGESRLANRKIIDLTEDDFDCSDSRTAAPGPTIPTTEFISKSLTTRKTQWMADPCDVYPCFNGGFCSVEGNLPQCRCTKEWAGPQCLRSLTTPTSTTTTTTRLPKTTRKSEKTKQSERPKLFINKDSITRTSVEIIIPITEKKLLMTVAEVGQKQKLKEITITPIAHPFTVKNLESGRTYNICIHLPLSIQNSRKTSSDTKDTLCGTVKTAGIKMASTPVAITRITIVSTHKVTKVEAPTEIDKDDATKSHSSNTETGEKFHGNANPETSPSETSEFQMLYPALGAGLGALAIIVLLVLFIFCYRQKRRLELKRKNGAEYIPGSPVDSNQTDMEMSTVVHHHHHNHYNASGINANGTNSPVSKKQSPKSTKSNQRNSILKEVPRNSVHYKTASIGASSNSSNSSNGGTMYSDRSLQYAPPHHYLPPPPVPPMQYDVTPPHINGRGNEFVYRNHTMNNPRLSIPNNHGVPPGGHYDVDILDDVQPLAGGIGQYHYGSTDAHLYPINPIHPSYLPPGASVAYQQTRSAFLPIQTPRNVNSRTPTSESIPITTQVNTARVIPTAACMNRNLVNDSITRYHDGVQVV